MQKSYHFIKMWRQMWRRNVKPIDVDNAKNNENSKKQAPLNFLMAIRGFTPKYALTLQAETKPNRLPTLAAIRSMASKYTRFQANKSPYAFILCIVDNDDNVENDEN